MKDKIRLVREISWESFGKRIHFYAPSFAYYNNEYFKSSLTSFPSISVTGTFCALNCSHCSGKILETMIQAQTPRRLIEVCSEIKKAGAVGCLISGGCLPDGSVPIARFADAINEIKKKLGLTIVVHSGLINLEDAKRLRDAGVDAVSIDIIGSEETIREIYNLDASLDHYAKSLDALKKSGIPFTPHVLIGLHYGTIKGEIRALDLISRYNPSALILIIFFPIKGTPMEFIKPPSPESVIEILVQARLMMPHVPIALGCARPKGKYRLITDLLAVEAGINAIAFPSPEAIFRAEKLGLSIRFSQVCCSQIYKDILQLADGNG